MNVRAIICGCIAAVAFASSVHADDQVPRHWIARIGVHPINPKPDNHPDFSVDNSTSLSLGATYLMTKHWAIELFSAFPNASEMHDADGTRVASFTMVPSSATLQYHITDASGIFRAYAAAGYSYTQIKSEHTRASLAGQSLDLDDASGLTAAVGLDMDLGSKWFMNVDARWLDIDSSMKIGGTPRGTLTLDPYMFGLSIGRRLR